MRNKTQTVQNQSHLYLQPISYFKPLHSPKLIISQIPSDDTQLLTNFNITVNNPYCFILLHLRNKTNKNPLNLNIPQTCIFYDKIPFDIIYQSKGYIRGYRGPEHSRVRLRDVFKVFKQAWAHKQLSKNQHSIAAFAQKQMLMLSDNDLLLATFKSKQDSFFKKLRYIQNKMPTTSSKPILIPYIDSQQQHKLIKLATQSLLGGITQQQCYKIVTQQAQKQSYLITKSLKQPQIQQLKQKAYLRFVNQKIILFLNYQHNIRIKRCIFVFKRTDEGKYYFANVHDLQFTNLTQAIKERQKRLLSEQQQRNKILIITPQKQIRYRSYQNRAHVKTYQTIMNGQFNSIVNGMNFHKMSDNKIQQVKNQIAFKKLHPRSKFTYTQVINSTNFIKVKDQVLENPSRKPITNPSRYVMRFYNKVRNTRVKTQVLNQVDF